LEGLVAQHLRAWLAYSGDDTGRLYYWRTKSGNEVDLVVYGRNAFFAVEIKNSRNVHRSDVSSLRAFQADYKMAQVALLYRGRERLLVDGVVCLPCEEFLLNLKPGREPLQSASL